MSIETRETAEPTEKKKEALKKLTELREQIRKRIGTVNVVVPELRKHRYE